MHWINLLIENGGLTAILMLLAVMYLERRITGVSDKLRDEIAQQSDKLRNETAQQLSKLRDKMDNDHRELQHSISAVKDSVVELTGRVARLEGLIRLPAAEPVAPVQ